MKSQYETLCAQSAYQAIPALKKALQRLEGETLEKACRFLAYENLPKTNSVKLFLLIPLIYCGRYCYAG